MKDAQAAIERLLEPTGVKLNGPNPWDPLVHDDRLYDRVLSEGSIGLGEAYMDGWWDSEQLDELFARILRVQANKKIPLDFRTLAYFAYSRIVNLQTKRHVWTVGKVHYDLGNDLFEATFDSRVTGSCGYWKNAKTLDEAQDAKLDLVCRKIGLLKGDSVFDIGCGWGAFMGYAAEKYGARPTGVTISQEQVAYIKKRYANLDIDARLSDYRDATGSFDHVVSMGMFEHVGPKNYRAYFDTARRLLKDDGLFLLHTIGSNVTTGSTDPWLDKYIFPHGVLPSIANIGRAIEGRFVMEDWHNFGADYDTTLMAWSAKFDSNWDKLKSAYDERFRRMWRYYLLSCAGGFRSRAIELWQIVLSKHGVPGGYNSVR